MKVYFHTYKGLAGDLQEMLVGRSECGQEKSRLIPATGSLRRRQRVMRRAKRKICRSLELLTGAKHEEA